MINFLKFDLIRNKKYFRNTSILYIIFLAIAMAARFIRGLLPLIEDKVSYITVFNIILAIFILTTIIFAYRQVIKDLYTPTSFVIFDLPISQSQYFGAKLWLIAIFCLYNLVFVFILLELLAFQVSIDLMYYFALGIIWIMLVFAISYYAFSLNRFRDKSNGGLIGLLVALLILVGGFFICRYFSLVLVGKSYQIASPFSYGFIYPFVIGKYGIYKNLTPIIYYGLALVGMKALNVNMIKNNLDL